TGRGGHDRLHRVVLVGVAVTVTVAGGIGAAPADRPTRRLRPTDRVSRLAAGDARPTRVSAGVGDRERMVVPTVAVRDPTGRGGHDRLHRVVLVGVAVTVTVAGGIGAAPADRPTRRLRPTDRVSRLAAGDARPTRVSAGVGD